MIPVLHILVGYAILGALMVSLAFSLWAILLAGRCMIHYWRQKP